MTQTIRNATCWWAGCPGSPSQAVAVVRIGRPCGHSHHVEVPTCERHLRPVGTSALVASVCQKCGARNCCVIEEAHSITSRVDGTAG